MSPSTLSMLTVRQSGQQTIHGHRGSRGTLPENTIAAFSEAFECGAHFFELDVHLTKDDVPVVFHDPEIGNNLCSLADGSAIRTPVAIKDIKATELAQFDCGNTLQKDFPEQQKLGKTKIPTLEEVFQWMKNNKVTIRANIEIKMERGNPRWLVDPEIFGFRVVQLLRKYDLLHRSIVQSFDPDPLKTVHRLEPRLTKSILFAENVDFIEVAKSLQARAIGPQYEMLTEELIQKAHDAKLEVLPWTVNNLDDCKRLFEWNVDGIITDFPRKLVQWKRANG